MPVTPVTPEARARLARYMEDRLRELRLTWQEVAVAGDVSVKALQTARTGQHAIRDETKRGIAAGLRWTEQSVDAILEGGEPVPLGPASAPGQRRLPVLHQGVDEKALAPYIRDVQALLLDAIDRCGPDPPGAEIFDNADEAAWWDGARREISPGRPLLFRDERVRRTALERMRADEARRAG